MNAECVSAASPWQTARTSSHRRYEHLSPDQTKTKRTQLRSVQYAEGETRTPCGSWRIATRIVFVGNNIRRRFLSPHVTTVCHSAREIKRDAKLALGRQRRAQGNRTQDQGGVMMSVATISTAGRRAPRAFGASARKRRLP